MAVVGVGVAPVGVGFEGATPPKGRVSGMPSGGSDGTPGNRHWGGMQAGYPGIPRRPRSAVRADGIRFGRKGTAEPSGRDASSRRRFCHRSSSTRRCWSRFQGRRASVSASKIRPGPGSAWKKTSEPGYHPHRLRYGTEIPLTRDLLRGAGSPTLPDQHHPPRKSVLLGEAFGFASTGPENLRPSTRHRDLHRPIHTDISTTIKQHNILGKHDPK